MSAVSKISTRFLALIIVIFLILGAVVVFFSCDRPAFAGGDGYLKIENIKGKALEPSLSLLDGLGISYEIVPVTPARPNVVLDVTFDGFEEGGVLNIKENTTVKIRANVVSPDKIVYLTFDDGPTRDNTLEILDILDEYGAVATFFVLGNRITQYSDRISAIYERGHEIGCHSYSHDLDSIYASTSALLSEIERFEQDLESVLGKEVCDGLPKLFRFPGGSSTNGYLSSSEADQYAAAVRGKGYRIYDWTALTNDADDSYRHSGESDKDYYIRSLKSGISKAKENGEPLIVLMHDKGAMKKCLRNVLDLLAAEGYAFDLISNCPEYTFVD